MVFIYILQLESNKYYVGKTSNPDVRLDSHFNSRGSEWTKKYKPIKVCELIENCDSYDEDKYTLKYMEKKGIENVRGGSFSQVELSTEQITFIEQMIKGSTDKCFKCGKFGHFIKDCIESKILDYLKDINDDNIQDYINTIDSIYQEILELNHMIKSTEIFLTYDFDELKELTEIIKKLDDLREQHQQANIALQKDRSSRYHIDKQLSTSQKINELQQMNTSKVNTIYQIYIHLIKNDSERRPDVYKYDPNILLLKIIKFNLEKKRRLKEIYREYHNEDFIKELLMYLYKKDIESIKTQIYDD